MFALFSAARPQLAERRGLYLATVAMRIGGAGLLAWIGYIHWHLWQEGYEFIRVSGPLFLVDAIAVLVISLAFGLFGFHESIHAAYVVESLIIESLAAIILGTWAVIAAAAVPRRG